MKMDADEFARELYDMIDYGATSDQVRAFVEKRDAANTARAVAEAEAKTREHVLREALIAAKRWYVEHIGPSDAVLLGTLRQALRERIAKAGT